MRYYKLVGRQVVQYATFDEMMNDIRLAQDDQAVGQICDTTVKGVRVSTVFLTIDHRRNEDGPPLVFETMVFGGRLDRACDRYSTVEEAEAGHARIVKQVREAEMSDVERAVMRVRTPRREA